MNRQELDAVREHRTKQFHRYLRSEYGYDEQTIEVIRKELPDVYKSTQTFWEKNKQ